jgi:uncharacterized protein
MARTPGKFVWFEHASRDARKAQAFYGEVLGWKVQRWGEYEMIFAGETPETMVGGYAAEGGRPRWISYVSVEDVDEAARAAAASGGKIVSPAHDVRGAGRVATIADPDGAELCLFTKEGGDPADGPRDRPPPAGRFFWNELHSPNPEKALGFYEKVLGMTRQTMEGPGGKYYILANDGVGRAGVLGEAEPGAARWLPYVSVDDPDATLSRARKLGAEICVGPADIPGVGRFGVLTDPTGASLAVMKAMPPSSGH